MTKQRCLSAASPPPSPGFDPVLLDAHRIGQDRGPISKRPPKRCEQGQAALVSCCPRYPPTTILNASRAPSTAPLARWLLTWRSSRGPPWRDRQRGQPSFGPALPCSYTLPPSRLIVATRRTSQASAEAGSSTSPDRRRSPAISRAAVDPVVGHTGDRSKHMSRRRTARSPDPTARPPTLP